MVAARAPETAPVLTPPERETLANLLEAIVPAGVGPADRPVLSRLGARSRGVDTEVERLWREYFPTQQREDFLRLLRVVESPALNLILSGHASRFSRLSPLERERYLTGWATSRLGTKRRGFQSIKRLASFLFYARPDPDQTNPVWKDIGYTPSSGAPRDAGAALPSGVSAEGPESDLAADVCVVGSGAGGAVIAATLARAGHSVVILESGPYRDRSSFTGREAESTESMFQRHGLLTTSDLAFQILAGETAGGSTTVNWMTCLRPSRLVRAEWEAAAVAGASGPTFDGYLDAAWKRLSVGRTESDVNPSNEVLRAGSERLGYALGSDYDVIDRNAVGCQRRCDFCSYGCPFDAKRSTLVTYLADALAAGARLFCRTRADHVLVENGHATGVAATVGGTGRGRVVAVRSKAVVVAGGAVQTPALLLRSGIRHGGVGAGLRLHPTTALLGEFPFAVESWRGPMQTIVVRRFVPTDRDEHGPWLESVPAHPGIAALALPWSSGPSHKELMSRLGRVAATIVLVRDVGQGRVDLDRAAEAALSFRLARRDRANLVRGIIEAARLHQAAGALRIQTLHARPITAGDGRQPVSPAELDGFIQEVRRAGVRENAVQLFSAHPSGSARIGLEPRTSAVGPDGECHGVENLWVGDGSLLPTAAGVNPMITIMAFAHRTAEAVGRRLAR